MKIYNQFEALILSTVSTKSKDGQSTYYKISMMDLASKEAGTVSCTEDVAKMVNPMTEYVCHATYDNTYNPASFRVTSISRRSDQKPSSDASRK